MYRHKKKTCNTASKLSPISDNVMSCFPTESKRLCANKIYFDSRDILSLTKRNDHFGDLLLERIFRRPVEKGQKAVRKLRLKRNFRNILQKGRLKDPSPSPYPSPSPPSLILISKRPFRPNFKVQMVSSNCIFRQEKVKKGH